ncbi:MAG: baseplate J/gp47 family protein [Pseudomonadota bacterium]
MPFSIPTLLESQRDVRDDVKAHLSDSDATLRASNLRAHADASGGGTHGLYGFLAWIARMVIPDSAEDDYLERWVNIWLPGGRKAASAASGSVTVTGIAGSVVDAGAILRSGGDDYTADTGATVGAGGTVSMTVTAASAGASANRATGDVLQFVGSFSGVDAQAVVADPGLAGGADIETDTEVKARMVARIQQPPAGGNQYDYVTWALEVEGCTRAWSRGAIGGVGTQTTFVMFDAVRASNNGIPEAADLALVQAYIDDLRPTTVREHFALAPVAVPLDFTISGLEGDTPAAREAIDEALAAMLFEYAEPGTTITQARILAAVSGAVSGRSYESTAASVTPAANQIIVPGTVTYV